MTGGRAGHRPGVLDDPIGLLAREVLRERTGALIAEACAWSVGLSDQPYLARRHGRVVDTGQTLGLRAESGLRLSSDEDGRLELAEARPGSFSDALNAIAPGGGLHADRLEEQVVAPFVLQTCVQTAERARTSHPRVWADLLDDLGEDPEDVAPEDVVRAAEWEAPLRADAEHLVLAALADVPLVEVEAEGLPLSLVRAAERETRRAAPVVSPDPAPRDEELAGALFLAEVALGEAGLPQPVAPAHADALLTALRGQGIEGEEVVALLPHLPVQQDTAERVAETVHRQLAPRGADRDPKDRPPEGRRRRRGARGTR